MTDQFIAEFEVLDCTIRDGGYLNNWNFDQRMVKDLYRLISRTGVDFIEIGYRNTSYGPYGIWHATPENLINNLLKNLSGIPIVLMVDFDKCDLKAIPLSKNSLVKMYRIAAHRDKIAGALRLCDKIKDRGYRTSLQLMGIAGYKKNDFKPLTKSLAKSAVDYIYFADSYGSLFPYDIKRYIDVLRPAGKKIGFHAHNSLQLAFANTLEATRNGIDIVDGTVYGMGRGAGNLPLEVLITYLEKTLNNKRYNAMPLFDLIDRYFIDLRNQLKWGYNLPHMLSGILEVHPNYASNLVERREYNVDDSVKILEIIRNSNVIGFKKEILDNIIKRGFAGIAEMCKDYGPNKNEILSLCKKYPVKYANRHRQKDFLVLASGPTLKKYKTDIDRFIAQYKPVVMGANYLAGLFKPHYHAFSNKKRFISYVDTVNNDSKLLISTSFDKRFIREYTLRKYEWIAHLDRVSSSFGIQGDVITSNCKTVSILLIAIAIVMGAKRIFIAGMDGYKGKDNFTAENIHFYNESQETEDFKVLMEKHNANEGLLKSINSFLLARNKEGLHIITPTSHSYFYNSIYNWVKR